MNRSRLRNKYLKYPSRKNFINMENMRNKLNLSAKNPKQKYLKRSTEKGIPSIKQFWYFVKPL